MDTEIRYIYTMEYESATKNKDIMNLEGKWENILSEVTIHTRTYSEWTHWWLDIREKVVNIHDNTHRPYEAEQEAQTINAAAHTMESSVLLFSFLKGGTENHRREKEGGT